MRGPASVAIACALAAFASGQTTLEFESGGLKYQAQTRAGVTIMIAPLPARILGYAILQVAISNGSVEPCDIQPENFQFLRPTAAPLRALSARAVVNDVMNRAGRDDVGRLINVYEAALYGNNRLELKHGYEARRKDAMAIGQTRKSAGAAAAAIVLGSSEVQPGSTVDGAVFFPTSNRPMGPGQLIMEAAGERFEFTIAPPPTPAR